jgi:hypothetical protein
MRISFEPLSGRLDLRQVLRADGWTLEGDLRESLVAEHPDATDATTARGRLHRLGLLTSNRLRIEFLACGTA